MQAAKKTTKNPGKVRSRPQTSHGEGRRFDPCRSHHSKAPKKQQNTEETGVFRGLPVQCIPYRSLPEITDNFSKRGKRGVNAPGRRGCR